MKHFILNVTSWCLCSQRDIHITKFHSIWTEHPIICCLRLDFFVAIKQEHFQKKLSPCAQIAALACRCCSSMTLDILVHLNFWQQSPTLMLSWIKSSHYIRCKKSCWSSRNRDAAACSHCWSELPLHHCVSQCLCHHITSAALNSRMHHSTQCCAHHACNCLISFDALTQNIKDQSWHNRRAIAEVSQIAITFSHIQFICFGRHDVRLLANSCRFIASMSAWHLAGWFKSLHESISQKKLVLRKPRTEDYSCRNDVWLQFSELTAKTGTA